MSIDAPNTTILESADDAGWYGATLDHLPTLYHQSPAENRDSILQHGLAQRFDQTSDIASAIYMSTKPADGGDIWAVDVKGLELELDHTDYDSGEFGVWWVYYDGDIPPSRLKRMTSLSTRTTARSQSALEPLCVFGAGLTMLVSVAKGRRE